MTRLSPVSKLPVANLLRLDRVGSRYGKRPSELLSIHDEYIAWCVDEACELAARFEAVRLMQEARETDEPELRDRHGRKLGTVRSQGVVFPKHIPILPEADIEQPPMVGVKAA